MKLFVSWSEEHSRQMALILRDWFRKVIQSATLWVSTEDIAKGKRWSDEIARELDACSFGIVCVTPQNQDSAWLSFEAGALAKSVPGSLEQGRVTPLLLGLPPSALRGPLAHFQATSFDRKDIFRLVKDVNTLSEVPLDEHVLQESFEVWWPRLERDVSEMTARISFTKPIESVPVDDEARVLEDILKAVRSHERTLLRIEQEIGSQESAERYTLSFSELAEEFSDLLLSTEEVLTVAVSPVGKRWEIVLDNLPNADFVRVFQAWALRRSLSITMRSSQSDESIQIGQPRERIEIEPARDAG